MFSGSEPCRVRPARDHKAQLCCRTLFRWRRVSFQSGPCKANSGQVLSVSVADFDLSFGRTDLSFVRIAHPGFCLVHGAQPQGVHGPLAGHVRREFGMYSRHALRFDMLLPGAQCSACDGTLPMKQFSSLRRAGALSSRLCSFPCSAKAHVLKWLHLSRSGGKSEAYFAMGSANVGSGSSSFGLVSADHASDFGRCMWELV